MLFQDGEMPQSVPADVKFTRKSWFGLKTTYKVVQQTAPLYGTFGLLEV